MIGKKVREAEIIVKNRIRNRYYWIHPEKLNFEDGKIEFEYHGPKPLGYLRKNHSIFESRKDVDYSLWEQSKILRNKKIQDRNQKEMIEELFDEVDEKIKRLNPIHFDDYDDYDDWINLKYWEWYLKNKQSLFDDLEWFPSRPA